MERVNLALGYLSYKFGSLASKAAKKPQKLKNKFIYKLCKRHASSFKDQSIYKHQPKNFRIVYAKIFQIDMRYYVEDVTAVVVRLWAENKFRTIKAKNYFDIFESHLHLRDCGLEIEYVYNDIRYVILYTKSLEYPPYSRKNDSRLKPYRCVDIDIEQTKLIRGEPGFIEHPLLETIPSLDNISEIDKITDDQDVLEVTDMTHLVLGPGDLLYSDTPFEIEKSLLVKWLLVKNVGDFKGLEILWTDEQVEVLKFKLDDSSNDI
jgi:hypothetical protein